MVHWCRRCGRPFTPKRATDRFCAQCIHDPTPFKPDPIDLHRQWS